MQHLLKNEIFIEEFAFNRRRQTHKNTSAKVDQRELCGCGKRDLIISFLLFRMQFQA